MWESYREAKKLVVVTTELSGRDCEEIDVKLLRWKCKFPNVNLVDSSKMFGGDRSKMITPSSNLYKIIVFFIFILQLYY